MQTHIIVFVALQTALLDGQQSGQGIVYAQAFNGQVSHYTDIKFYIF